MDEAPQVDGAGAWTQYWTVTMSRARPSLAALQFVWIYSEFFWTGALMTTNDPVTSALSKLRGEFLTNNLVAAGATIIAVPTLVVFFVLQMQLVSGLTVGASRG